MSSILTSGTSQTKSTLKRAGVVACALLVAACAEDAERHVPPFARKPYEQISRESIVAIAMREWRLFGSPVAEEAPLPVPAGQPAKPERQEGLWQRVGEYWWLGLDAGAPQSAWTGKHDEHGAVFPPTADDNFAWSAAFVSYVMRMAGAGSRFPYSPDHQHYIDIAKRQALSQASGWLVTAEQAQDYAPRLGDLICIGRDEAANLRFDDLPAGHYFPAHCDIVVDVSTPGEIGMIGGNERDAVTLRHVAVGADGKLQGSWLAILKLEGVPDKPAGATADFER